MQIGKKHLKWQNMKMKVKLAAEVLSSSVADALEYLKDVDERFEGVHATVVFIRTVSIEV